MTYYEELAVSREASEEEIRQAYRVLARLLHPDNQPDPKLKSVAERQMVRLNEILATLVEPGLRRKYDESLSPSLARFRFPLAVWPLRSRLLRHWPWALAAGVLVTAATWYVRSNESASPIGDHPLSFDTIAVPANLTPNGRAKAGAHKPAAARRRQSLVEAQPDAGRSRSPATSSSGSAGRAVDSPENSAAADPLDHLNPPEVKQAAEIPFLTASVSQNPGPPPPMAPPPPATFAGHWLYAPEAAGQSTSNLYPPEFIDLFLSEKDDALSGKYRARYRVPNKAVSPEVQFEIHGSLSGRNAASLQWISNDGAKGECRVLLVGPNSMEVNWWTSALGRQTVFTSGTAVLIRQLKP